MYDDTDVYDWQEYALCQGLPLNLFFDDYEKSPGLAKVIDQACLSCPVIKQCGQWGVETGEHGVWGGIYLTSGKPDADKNGHKTPDIWEQVRERYTE